jgi:glutamine amidotransferase
MRTKEGIPEVVIVDYGMGNIGSIRNMLRHVGASSRVACTPDELPVSGGIILPGVGHFDRAMQRLKSSGMSSALVSKVSSGAHLLGICLGMQLLCKGSEEGNEKGLEIVDAEVSRFRFPAQANYKVPHMGWNEVEVLREGTVLGGVEKAISRFYFVHSFYVDSINPSMIAGRTTYGISFVSALKTGNVTGVQFHPEKSHRFGMQLFRNFIGGLV